MNLDDIIQLDWETVLNLSQITVEKTSNPWIELGNDLIDVSPTWGTGL